MKQSEESIIRDHEIAGMNSDYKLSRAEWRREKAAGEVFDEE